METAGGPIAGQVDDEVRTAGHRPGARELNKRAKLRRIRAAAREVFLTKGFEGATVREIAAAADVALGTLFLYAEDKQDLLLLIFEEDLPELRRCAVDSVQTSDPFVDQLVTFFRALYRYFAGTRLSRDLLREITFGRGRVARRLGEDLAETELEVAKIVSRAQARGQIHDGIAPNMVAHVIFSLHRVEIRRCLLEEVPDTEGSIRSLRRQIDVVVKGLLPESRD